MEEIQLGSPEIEWIAENDEEKQKIHIFSFRKDVGEPIIPYRPIPHEILKRAIVACYDCFEW